MILYKELYVVSKKQLSEIVVPMVTHPYICTLWKIIYTVTFCKTNKQILIIP